MNPRCVILLPALLLALSGCGKSPTDETAAPDKPAAVPANTSVTPALDPKQADEDLRRRVQPHLGLVSIAYEAVLQGNFPAAVGIMQSLTNKAPDVPEFRQLEAAFRDLDKTAVATAIKKNRALARPRLSVEQLQPADRTRVTLLMKRMQQIGQMPPDQRAAPAGELLTDVQKLTLEQPNLTRGWLMQASLCLLLDDALHGKLAARNLAELRAQESVSPSVQALLRQLQTKGWLSAEIKLPEPTQQAAKN